MHYAYLGTMRSGAIRACPNSRDALSILNDVYHENPDGGWFRRTWASPHVASSETMKHHGIW
jgi:hypothetical protein